MATFDEVAAELQRVSDKAGEAIRALVQAGQLAEEAASLLAEIMHGAEHLEQEFDQAVQAWSSVTAGAAELAALVTRVLQQLGAYRRTLQGDAVASSAAHPGPSAPAPSLPNPAGQTWLDRQRSQLPTYITSGIYRDEDGNCDVIQSGQDPPGEHQAIADHLRAEGFPPTGPGRVTTGEHVEGKVAWRLRNSGGKHVDLVINFPMCAGPYSCKNLVPFILKPGQSMTVHDPRKTRTFHGRSTR